MSVSKKLAELRDRRSNGKPTVHAGFAELGVTHPDLAEFLTPQMVKGQSQPGGTILIFVEDGRLKACVTDRFAGMRFFTVLATALDPWKTISELIFDPSTDWRPSENGRKR